MSHFKFYSAKIYNHLYNAFATDDYIIQKVSIHSEFHIENIGRLDLYIELTLIVSDTPYIVKLIIENKVESKENNDQTTKYFDYFDSIQKQPETTFYKLSLKSKHVFFSELV